MEEKETFQKRTLKLQIIVIVDTEFKMEIFSGFFRAVLGAMKIYMTQKFRKTKYDAFVSSKIEDQKEIIIDEL